MGRYRKISLKQYDWFSLLLYVILVATGIVLLSTIDSVQNVSLNYAKKQLIWAIISFFGLIIIYFFNVKKIREWGSLIYLISIILLAGLFIFGKEVSGAKAWYRIGSFGFQPTEFAKLAVALGLAKLLSEREFSLNHIKNIGKVFILLAIPVVLILLQPDLGSVLVFSAFVIVLYREGLNGNYIFIVGWLILLFFLTIKYNAGFVLWGLIILFMIVATGIYIKMKKHRWNYLFIWFAFMFFSAATVQLTSYMYHHVLKPHQQQRIALLLGKISDDKGVGYHLKQSLIAISNGGWNGQGFKQGAQLKGNYIPEQHTDYIFTALAEQFGWVGSVAFVFIYLVFIIRLYMLAERQKQKFSRIIGYSLASLLAIHFFINILMVLGLFPVVGIPIIFISYGGSSLFFFSLFLFLFLKFDANRVEEF